MKKLLAVSFLSLLSLPVLASDWRGWEDFSIAGSNERHWICGMDNIKGAGQSQNVSIKLIESTPFIQFDLYKNSWSFPQGSSVPVRLDFDDNAPLDLKAYGDGQIVSIAIPVEMTNVFLSLVNDKQRIRVMFRDGNEPVWSIGLDGAHDALFRMLSCFKKNRALQ